MTPEPFQRLMSLLLVTCLMADSVLYSRYQILPAGRQVPSLTRNCMFTSQALIPRAGQFQNNPALKGDPTLRNVKLTAEQLNLAGGDNPNTPSGGSEPTRSVPELLNDLSALVATFPPPKTDRARSAWEAVEYLSGRDFTDVYALEMQRNAAQVHLEIAIRKLETGQADQKWLSDMLEIIQAMDPANRVKAAWPPPVPPPLALVKSSDIMRPGQTLVISLITFGAGVLALFPAAASRHTPYALSLTLEAMMFLMAAGLALTWASREAMRDPQVRPRDLPMTFGAGFIFLAFLIGSGLGMHTLINLGVRPLSAIFSGVIAPALIDLIFIAINPVVRSGRAVHAGPRWRRALLWIGILFVLLESVSIGGVQSRPQDTGHRPGIRRQAG